MVGIAQLVEHLVVVQVVAGSSPVTHPKSEPALTTEAVRAGFVVHDARNRLPSGAGPVSRTLTSEGLAHGSEA